MRFTAPSDRLSLLALLALAGLAGCDPAAPPSDPAVYTNTASAAAIAASNCDAQSYQYMINGPIEQVSAITYPGTVRVLGPDSFVTKDFDPHRLTVTTRRERGVDKVGRIFCG